MTSGSIANVRVTKTKLEPNMKRRRVNLGELSDIPVTLQGGRAKSRFTLFVLNLKIKKLPTRV